METMQERSIEDRLGDIEAKVDHLVSFAEQLASAMNNIQVPPAIARMMGLPVSDSEDGET